MSNSLNKNIKNTKKNADKDEGAQESHSGGGSYSRRSGDVKEPEGGSAIWLISFTDVMALMLTFFVMLFAMSEPEKEQWSEVMLSLRSEMNSYYGPAYSQGPQETINLSKINLDRALDIGYLDLLINSVVNESEFLNDAVINRQRDHLVISLPDRLLFAAGDAEPVDQGLRALYALGGPLSRIKNKIEIIGHADPRPVGEGNNNYDSNWDLSLARALNVAAVLENVGYEKSIIVRGLSDGRYQDIGNAVSEEQRLALSRRVDIMIMNHDGRKDDIFSDLDFK
jgi:chemotaxis protein MotB